MFNIYEKLKNKETRLSVIGLGYVGLPIALEFASVFDVIGLDIDPKKIELLKNKRDPGKELPPERFENKSIEFTTHPEKLKEASFHIIAVPTPIDNHNLPDLKPLLSATSMLVPYLKKGDYVVYESTVYPGATEEDCLPLLEKSGLRLNQDFKLGYSPERINPGDAHNTLVNIIKIVSGSDSDALENIAKVYESIIKAGVHRASNIKVAEAAKVIENTQRDVNIALMNELSIIFNRMGINTYEVLEAAGTKWNFLKFSPGLVGGHCIGVDPYYLAFKAKEYRYHPQIINAGRFVNDSMGFYVAKQTVKKLIAASVNIRGSRVLVMGITFKENVADIRNSRVADLVSELKSYGVDVDVTDPHANPEEVFEEYGIRLMKPEKMLENKYDAVVVAVSHKEYMSLNEAYFQRLMGNKGILVDVKGIYRGNIQNLTYWSL